MSSLARPISQEFPLLSLSSDSTPIRRPPNLGDKNRVPVAQPAVTRNLGNPNNPRRHSTRKLVTNAHSRPPASGDVEALIESITAKDSKGNRRLVIKELVETAPDTWGMGNVLADIIIEKVLGFGGSSTVLAGRLMNGMLVAVKVINANVPAAYMSITKKCNLQETALTPHTRSIENIRAIHRAGDLATGQPYLVIERLDGSFHDVMEAHGLAETMSGTSDLSATERVSRFLGEQSGPAQTQRRVSRPTAITFNLESVMNVFIQAVRGMAGLHRQKIVHRDFKPENCMFLLIPGNENRMVVKVIDLGSATYQDDEAQKHPDYEDHLPFVSGTPGFIPPECLTDAIIHGLKKRPNHPTVDVFAMGVALYEMLTGQHPFLDNQDDANLNFVRKTRALTEQDIIPPSKARPDRHIPASLDRIVKKAMHPDHEKRYQSAEEMEIDLLIYKAEDLQEKIKPIIKELKELNNQSDEYHRQIKIVKGLLDQQRRIYEDARRFYPENSRFIHLVNNFEDDITFTQLMADTQRSR